jgi:hypothetical protein
LSRAPLAASGAPGAAGSGSICTPCGNHLEYLVIAAINSA